MDKQEYEIQGHYVYQMEMTLGQDIELIRFFREMKGKADWTDPVAIIDEITNAGLLERLIKIVLRGEVGKIDVNELTNSELEAIVTDFFGLNGRLIEKLKDSLSSLTQSLDWMESLGISEIKKPNKSAVN